MVTTTKRSAEECPHCHDAEDPSPRAGIKRGSFLGAKKLDRIWVGAFAIPPGHRLFGGVAAEATVIGHYDGTIRASIEHEPRALLSLITMCRQIANDENLKLRLLEFTNPRELSEEEVQEWLNLCSGRQNLQ